MAREIKLSDFETKLLQLLPTYTKRMTTEGLAKAFYKKKMPWNGRQIILVRLRYLEAKLRHMKSKTVIKISARCGPKPVEVWQTKSK